MQIRFIGQNSIHSGLLGVFSYIFVTAIYTGPSTNSRSLKASKIRGNHLRSSLNIVDIIQSSSVGWGCRTFSIPMLLISSFMYPLVFCSMKEGVSSQHSLSYADLTTSEYSSGVVNNCFETFSLSSYGVLYSQL